MQYKTIVIAVLSALALSACGAGGGGGVEMSTSLKDSASAKDSDSLDVSQSTANSMGKSSKTTTTVSAPALIGVAAKPAIAANGINLYNRASYFAYVGGPISMHEGRLEKLGLASPNQGKSTEDQIARAKALKATLKDGPGMTTALRRKLDACLATVIEGDAAAGRACLLDYYQRIYGLTGAMMDTWPQASPEFDTEVNQKFSSERSFPVKDIETYATSGCIVANLSISLKSALADVPPSLVMKGAEDAYERMVDNLFAIPLDELVSWMSRPAQRQKLDVDFEVLKGEANVGPTLHFFDTGMVLKADASGWSVVMNGVPFHGGESGLLNGGKKEFTLEGNAGLTAENRSNSTSHTSAESSSSQETSSGFKF